MAMTGAGLKTAIIAELTAAGFNISHPDTNGEAEAYVEAFATAIVEYIQSNARAADVGSSGSPAGNWPIV